MEQRKERRNEVSVLGMKRVESGGKGGEKEGERRRGV